MKSTCHNSSVKHYQNGYYCTKCFKEQFKPTKGIWILYIGLPIILLLAVFPVKAPTLTKVIGTYSLPGFISNDIIPSDSTVLEQLAKHHCVLAAVAVAQARIESGNYTSDIAIHNKNLFGIKVHKCEYVAGERDGHATFNSFKDNIACYCNIQKLYLRKIDRSYAEDTLYCAKIKQMK
jgi:hypothetical protein